MRQYETEHYIFNFISGSKAEQDIQIIADCQEICASVMCSVLGVRYDYKIQYFLYDTAEEVGRMHTGEPCNGLAVYPDKIYAVYNNEVQCIGFHEDAHLISFMHFDPNPWNPAIEEGFAEYFCQKWWGIDHISWVGYYLKCGKYMPIGELFDADGFYAKNDCITYPIMGAFTEWLVKIDGLERYLNFFRKRGEKSAMVDFYGKTPEEMNDAFVKYIKLFKIDEVLEQRMADLSTDW